jgi:hypothetical protein
MPRLNLEPETVTVSGLDKRRPSTQAAWITLVLGGIAAVYSDWEGTSTEGRYCTGPSEFKCGLAYASVTMGLTSLITAIYAASTDGKVRERGAIERNNALRRGHQRALQSRRNILSGVRVNFSVELLPPETSGR